VDRSQPEVLSLTTDHTRISYDLLWTIKLVSNNALRFGLTGFLMDTHRYRHRFPLLPSAVHHYRNHHSTVSLSACYTVYTLAGFSSMLDLEVSETIFICTVSYFESKIDRHRLHSACIRLCAEVFF
jgi:hypothetical protein